ncbi:MAG: hypothetical protein FD161_3026 [Limisphaerales bacterium]|nr:MAG: hypothetical protein FD161_3026 [Limisphaerales bacterium]KAG0508139.1 MAG: hypothetical protein E1N63_2733 [Limisphaerales bacterium]TXT53008.1 MAG: hypothetical protein FD140_116 [Limisphaerales bacterium]
MNVFTFKPRFEAPALAGVKIHTLRGHRKDGKPRAQVGERISLRVWTGRPYASKQREFAQATVEHVVPVHVTRLRILRADQWDNFSRGIGPEPTSLDRRQIARRDGFANWREMKAFFQAESGLPFSGVMVVWKDLMPTKA